MFHYKYYAILQQLGLISANQFVPKLLFMVPFSSESPFHSPPLPPDFSLRSIATYLHQFTIVIAPLAALHIWYKYSNTLIGTIYHHIYELLPHATNLGAASDREIKAQIAKLEEAQARLHASNLHGTQVDNLDEELLAEPLSPGASDISHETDSWDTEDSVYLSAAGRDSTLTDRSRSEGDPATLAALEGRAQPHGQARERERRSSAPSPPPHDSTPPPPQFYDPVPRDRSASLSSTSTAHNAVPTTLISFDVEATSEPADASGNYSAELRNANDAPTADNDPAMSKRVIYDVTAMSLLPAHLFADGVVVLIATACAVPLESVMVRCIARSWACKTGMSAARRAQMWDMWPRRHRWTAGLSRGVLANVVVGFLCDLCVTGVIWGGCLGTWAALDWWNREEEGKDGEGR